MPKRLLAAAMLTLLAACDLPLDGGDGPAVRARAGGQTLSVTNTGSRPVHHMVYEYVDAGTIFWGKCTPANQECPVLAPGQTLRIPYTELGGYDPGDTQAIVYWWESEPDGAGGYRVAREGEKIVRL